MLSINVFYRCRRYWYLSKLARLGSLEKTTSNIFQIYWMERILWRQSRKLPTKWRLFLRFQYVWFDNRLVCWSNQLIKKWKFSYFWSNLNDRYWFRFYFSLNTLLYILQFLIWIYRCRINYIHKEWYSSI